MLLFLAMCAYKSAYSEPKGSFSKPLVLEELRKKSAVISGLGLDELTNWPGQEIAMDIAGLLAFHSSRDVRGEEWLTSTREPVLYEILQIAAGLELNPEDDEAWAKIRIMLDHVLTGQGADASQGQP